MAFLLLAALPALALAEPKSPYAGQERRAIKALSPEEVEGLLGGAGLGFAKTAELNHHPGPAHVLEAKDALGLTAAQLAETQALFEKMRREAMALGRRVVDAEAALEERFASGRITESSLKARVSEIARLRGALRVVHLMYHLKMKTLLTPHQIAAYDRLRGYSAPGEHPRSHKGH